MVGLTCCIIQFRLEWCMTCTAFTVSCQMHHLATAYATWTMGHRKQCVESSWNVMAHGDAWEGKWRGNWWMEWVASTLHTTLEHGVSSITTADVHTPAASGRLNWRPRWFKWTRPFRLKTKSDICVCAITFQTQSTSATETWD